MTITAEISGNGSFRGASSNVGAYSIKREATPLNPASSAGATGEFSFDATATVNSPYLYRSGVTLTDEEAGLSLAGSITSVSQASGFIQLVAHEEAEALVAEYQVPPFHGPLLVAIQNCFALAGIPSERVVFYPQTPNPLVALPGGELDVWVWIKELCSAHQIEMYRAGDLYAFGTPGMKTLPTENVVAPQVNVRDGQLARAIEVNYYNNTYMNNELIYPAGGWNAEVPVYQVDAGETTEVDFELPVSVMSFQEPVMVEYVSSDYDGPTSVYAIHGNDGLPVPTRLWQDQGGEVSLELLDDTTTMRLTIRGPRGFWAEEYGPFRLAMAAGEGGSNSYSSLRIIGEGVFMDERTVTCPTGVPASETVEEIGVTIENRAIATKEQAQKAAVLVAYIYGGSEVSYDTSSATTQMVDDGLTPESAILDLGFSKFRVDSFDSDPVEGSITATPWTTFEDFDETWGSGTFEDFDDEFGDLTFREFAIAPLRRLT